MCVCENNRVWKNRSICIISIKHFYLYYMILSITMTYIYLHIYTVILLYKNVVDHMQKNAIIHIYVYIYLFAVIS